ncbi:hypothetical protein AB3515_14490 [Acinetobacter baumannii]
MDQELTLQDANYLNKEDKRTLALSSLGGALEFYDFVIYVFYAKIISDLFSQARLVRFGMLNTYGIFAAGYFFVLRRGCHTILVIWWGVKTIFAFYFADGAAYPVYRDFAHF